MPQPLPPAGLPHSAYFGMSGRVGRAGRPAGCHVLQAGLRPVGLRPE